MYDNYHDKVNKFGLTLDRILKLYTTFRLQNTIQSESKFIHLGIMDPLKLFLIIMRTLLRILAQVKKIIHFNVKQQSFKKQN